MAQLQQRPDDAAERPLVELAWNSPDLLMMLDFGGTIRAVNPAWTITLDRVGDSLARSPHVGIFEPVCTEPRSTHSLTAVAGHRSPERADASGVVEHRTDRQR